MPTPNRRRSRRRIAQEANLLKLDTDIKTKHFMKLQVAKDEHKNTQTYIYIYINSGTICISPSPNTLSASALVVRGV
jgi:hypothetical protein